MADKNADLASCEEAFNALKSYDRGSARSSLLPIDRAVTAALKNEKARAAMEARLLQALKAGGSTVAREYLCAKLAVIASAASAPALAVLATDPQLATAARNALEAIPGAGSAKAVRQALAKARGLARIGLINSLGAKRDPAAVGSLAECLRDSDEQVVRAAAAALGEIGTVRAARILREQFPGWAESRRRMTADAVLVCAERLAGQGRTAEAAAVSQLLASAALPAYIQKAAATISKNKV